MENEMLRTTPISPSSLSSSSRERSVIPIDSLLRTQTARGPTTVDLGTGGKADGVVLASHSDVANLSMFSKPFQHYSSETKYTFYTTRTDIRQGSTLDSLVMPEEREESLFGGMGNSAGGTPVQVEEPFWLDVTAPKAEDLATLATRFGVHPLTVEDVQMRDSREKCEVFEMYLFICVRTVDQRFFLTPTTTTELARRQTTLGATGEVSTEPQVIYILVFRDFVLSAHHEPIPHIRRVLRRMYTLRTVWGLTADWVMYSLLDETVDEFMPPLQTLQVEVDAIDELVLLLTHNEQSDMLRRIGRSRKRVTHLLRLLKPKIEILKMLTKRCPDYLRPHTLIYLRDVNDHVLTMLQNLEQYAETLNRSHSNYLAHISIELNEASNRMNIVMKKLTAAAALVLPLSLISGIWGMNVPVPGQPDIVKWQNLIPFFLIVGFMIILMVFMYWVGHRNDWW